MQGDEEEEASRFMAAAEEKPDPEAEGEDDAPTAYFVRPAALVSGTPSRSPGLKAARRPWWRSLIDALCFWRRRPSPLLPEPELRATPLSPASSPMSHVRVSAPKAPRGPIATLVSPHPLGQRAVVDEVHTLLWGFEPHELGETARLIEYIVAARLAGPARRVEAQILHALTYIRPEEDGTVGLAFLRGKLLGVARSAVDQALLRLEEQGRVVLLPADLSSATRQPTAGLEHPTRGLIESGLPSLQPRRRGPHERRAVLHAHAVPRRRAFNAERNQPVRTGGSPICLADLSPIRWASK